MKVLIIDDSKVARMAIAEFFKQIEPNLEIVGAQDGYEAVEEAEKKQFDCITVDYNMPGINGFDIAKKIAEIQKTAIIVILTANIQKKVQERIESNGFHFFSKPVTLEVIHTIFDLAKKK
jgi:two-component system, chemotaxis family, chemotaxis protein CheY